MVEFDLAKILERIEQKLDRHIENTQKDLTDLKIGQIRLEEKTATLTSGQDAINAKLNTQGNWLLSLLTALVVGILGLVAAVGKVVFFPSA